MSQKFSASHIRPTRRSRVWLHKMSERTPKEVRPPAHTCLALVIIEMLVLSAVLLLKDCPKTYLLSPRTLQPPGHGEQPQITVSCEVVGLWACDFMTFVCVCVLYQPVRIHMRLSYFWVCDLSWFCQLSWVCDLLWVCDLSWFCRLERILDSVDFIESMICMSLWPFWHCCPHESVMSLWSVWNCGVSESVRCRSLRFHETMIVWVDHSWSLLG